MNKLLKNINKSIKVLLLSYMLYKIIFIASTMTFTKILTVLCIIPIIMVPYILDKIIKYKMSETLELVYFLFIIIALILGSIEGWYYKIGWFDLFAHFLSGIASSFASLIIIKKMNLIKKENTFFIIIFMISFTLMIASGWEFFEFCSDKVFKGDVQWVALTGVDDTMTDMLIALLGSIGFSIYYVIQIKLNEKMFLNNLNRIL